MTRVVRANTQILYYRHPRGGGHFRPNGEVAFVGNEEVFQKNRKETWDAEAWAARIIVGFNVGNKPKWTMNDVVKIVKSERQKQGRAPNSSFLAQQGIWKDEESGKIVVEKGAQVLLINEASGVTEKEWEAEMVELAEKLAQRLKQDKVILEIQKAGQTLHTYGIYP